MSSAPSDHQGIRRLDASLDADGRIPFRVRIGVCGHRKFANESRVAAHVAESLRDIRAVFAGSPNTPVRFTILSALAEGADRLVVREAFAVLGDDVRLEAVLPRDAGAYMQDFPSASSRREFEQLLTRASHRTMPAVPDPTDGYENAGRYVVDHSDLLVAVWDGEPARGRAGTGEVVTYARDRHHAVVIVDPEAAAATASHPQSLDASTSLYDVLASLRRLDEYNAGSLDDTRFQRPLAEQWSRLERGLSEDSPIRTDVDQVAEWALPRFVRAEVRAVQFQRASRFLGDLVYVLAALAVTTVAAQSVFTPEHTRVLALEIVCLLLIIVVVLGTRIWQVQERWLDYRSLAEAFRSALFVALTGARDRSEVRGRTEVHEDHDPWYQRAFSESWTELQETRDEPDDDAALSRFIIDAWLDDQIEYHREAALRFGVRNHRIGLIVVALMTAALIVAVLHLIEVGEETRWADWFTFLAIALPGFGAALTGIRDRRQFRLHRRRSLRAAARLQRLKVEVETGLRPSSAGELAVEIQRIRLEESVEWSGVQELQDLEIVI